jgi:hypothetical protein
MRSASEMQHRTNGRWSRGEGNPIIPYAPSHDGPPTAAELVAPMPTPHMHAARARTRVGVPRTLADALATDQEGDLVALPRTGSFDNPVAVCPGGRVRPLGWPRTCRVRRSRKLRAAGRAKRKQISTHSAVKESRGLARSDEIGVKGLQLAPHDLPGRGPRQVGHELHGARHLVNSPTSPRGMVLLGSSTSVKCLGRRARPPRA